MEQRKKPPISFIPICFFFFFLATIAHGLKDQSSSSTMRLELVHRHDPRVQHLHGGKKQSLNRFERIQELAQRDMIRHTRRKALEAFEMPIHSGRDMGAGEYFVQVKVGTPFQTFWAVADTGSDLTWFRCNDKPQNFASHPKRRSPGPSRLFSPYRSRTFRPVNCSSDECKLDLGDLGSLKACPTPSAPCLYDFRYLDGSAAMGLFGRDTITVGLADGRKARLKNMVVGCTRSLLPGPVIRSDYDGLVGLGLSINSFVGIASLPYGGKFSYCLVDHLSHRNVSSFLTFGSVISKANLLSEIRTTPLNVTPPFYGLYVEGISVGGQLLRIPRIVWDYNANGGGITLDTGTTLTLLAMPAYKPVVEALAKPLDVLEKMKPFSPFKYCYRTRGFNESLVPRLTFHLEGGARFEPPVKNYVIDVTQFMKCIGIVGMDADSNSNSIMGNIMQQNYLWEFDLLHNTVQFAPSPCC